VSLHCNLRHLQHHDASVTPCPPPLPTTTPHAQVVSLHCNLDEATHHLINKQRLALMKPDAVLVNAARGPCIDEAALVEHMKTHPDFRAGGRRGKRGRGAWAGVGFLRGTVMSRTAQLGMCCC
jgi:lactate dehydrogenase-like 2-hydroxyacid dehydrogenase